MSTFSLLSVLNYEVKQLEVNKIGKQNTALSRSCFADDFRSQEGMASPQNLIAKLFLQPIFFSSLLLASEVSSHIMFDNVFANFVRFKNPVFGGQTL